MRVDYSVKSGGLKLGDYLSVQAHKPCSISPLLSHAFVVVVLFLVTIFSSGLSGTYLCVHLLAASLSVNTCRGQTYILRLRYLGDIDG